MNTYVIGNLVQLTGSFYNASGVLTNPTTVTCQVKYPDSSVGTLSASSSVTGVYTAQLSVVQAGLYTYRFAGTGALQAAQENTLFVNDSAFTA